MSGGGRVGAAKADGSRWWRRMLASPLGIVLSVLAATAHIALPPSSPTGSAGSPGITTSVFPDAAVYGKVRAGEGFRLHRVRHLPSISLPGSVGHVARGRVPALTLRPELVHVGPHRSPPYRTVPLRAPPLADQLS